MRIPSILLLTLALAIPALAGDAVETKSVAIGDVVPAFELSDLDGATFSLAAAREISDEEALASALRAMKGLADDAVAGADTMLDTVGAMKAEDGTVDPAKVKSWMREAGRPYGLIPSDDACAEVQSVEDVVSWITDSASAPIVFMCWSPMCPTSRRYEQRLQDAVAATGARFYALASNTPKRERDEDAVAYLEKNGLPYRVLLDREQMACDILGGKVTPHVFVLNGENQLAYAGSIDSDPRFQTKTADERQNWLHDALESLANERMPDVMLTRPKG